MKLKQISVPMENSHNRLHELLRELGDKGLYPRALTLADTGNLGELRILVSDTAKARQLLMQKGIPGRVEDVVAVQLADKPNQLADLLLRLTANDITVNYGYALAGMNSANTVMIFHFSDNDKALRILGEKEVGRMDGDDLQHWQAAC